MEMSWQTVKAIVREVIREEMAMGRYEMARRFEDGKLVFHPGDPALKTKEVPVDIFFKKITSVREKLRVLEQKINNAEGLGDIERAELQMYITRAYGSLTTFNFLFANEEDHFEGMKGA